MAAQPAVQTVPGAGELSDAGEVQRKQQQVVHWQLVRPQQLVQQQLEQ
jgi:hypothetical protein